MELISLNVGLPREIVYKGRKILTGILKTPVAGRVQARTLNLPPGSAIQAVLLRDIDFIESRPTFRASAGDSLLV